MLGTPMEARWARESPRADLHRDGVEARIRRAFPSGAITGIKSLDGLRNTSFKLAVGGMAVVLRIYEHDTSLCRKEIDLFHAIGNRVPLPQILYAEPDSTPPFSVFTYVEGCTFQHLKQTGSAEEIQQAAYAVGQTLAAIGTLSFECSGWIGPGPSVKRPMLDGPDPEAHFVDLCLESQNLRRWVDPMLSEKIHAMAWRHAEQFRPLGGEKRLVHGDFGKRNVLMQKTGARWSVAAVIDWELAVAASPLIDLGHFLRYERAARPVLQPAFSRGFTDRDGCLPAEWRRTARVLDALALCESLTHDDLAEPIAAEIVELLRATAEDRDPILP